MFGIATTGGRRGQSDLDWRVKAGLFSLSALTAGVACGATLGGLGGLLSEQIRITLGSVAALVLAGVGLAQLRPASSFRLLERNCETAQGWLQLGPVWWAIVNGAALGSGFLSRIGFVSWYAVPLASLAFGSPLIGALVYGLYGGVRGFAVWLWLAGLRRTRPRRGDPPEAVLELGGQGKPLSAALLVTLATATIVVAGL